MRTVIGLAASTVVLVWCVARPVDAGDCNENGVDDRSDLENGTSSDCNLNGVPDECDLVPGSVHFDVGGHFKPENARSSLTPVVADLDGDGDLDVAINVTTGIPADRIEDRNYEHHVVVYHNRGAGDYVESDFHTLTVRSGFRSGSIVAEDLDGDADLDLAVISGPGSAEGPYGFTVFHNRGDGTFAVAQEGPEGNNPRGPAFADLDGRDGPDMIIANMKDASLSILPNRGDGTFGEETKLDLRATPPYVPEAGDLDGDGDLDLVFTVRVKHSSDDWEDTVGVLLNEGDLQFAAVMVYEVGGLPTGLVLEDFDRDGDLDIAAASYLDDKVSVLQNRGDGTFEPAVSYGVGEVTEDLYTRDLNGDGNFDLVASGWDVHGNGEKDHVSILLNQGDGTFSESVITRFPAHDRVKEVDFGDVDGDGDLDIVTANGINGDSNTISVLQNRGDGAFRSPADFAADLNNLAAPRDVKLADVDRDGDLDAITANQYGGFHVLFNREAGEALLPGCVEFVRGDVNTDGQVSIADLIALRRWMYSGLGELPCVDAADVIDDDRIDICDHIEIFDTLFQNPDWTTTISAPFPEPGIDPTPFAIPGRIHGCPDIYRDAEGHTLQPFGCDSYEVEPPQPTDAVVAIGSLTAGPGQRILIPVSVTSSQPFDGVQLVLSYDPDLLHVESGDGTTGRGLLFDGTVMEPEEGFIPWHVLTTHPESRVLTIGIAGSLLDESREIPAGEDLLIAWIRATVSEDAQPGAVITLSPPEAPVGPYRMQNELSLNGEARFVSVLPEVEGARLAIVGDQSVFIRGDPNGDKRVDLSDAVYTLGWLFIGGDETYLDCKDAADTDDNGVIDLSDAVIILDFLFRDGTPIPAPHPDPGWDETEDELWCYPSPQPR